MRCFRCQQEVKEFYLVERLFNDPVAICTNCYPDVCKGLKGINVFIEFWKSLNFKISRKQRQELVAEIAWIKKTVNINGYDWIGHESGYRDRWDAEKSAISLERDLNDLPQRLQSCYHEFSNRLYCYGAPLLKEGDEDFNRETFDNPYFIKERNGLIDSYSKNCKQLEQELLQEQNYMREGYPYASIVGVLQEIIQWFETSIKRLSDNEQYIHIGTKHTCCKNDSAVLIATLEKLLGSYQERYIQLQKDYEKLQRKYEDLKRMSKYHN